MFFLVSFALLGLVLGIFCGFKSYFTYINKNHYNNFKSSLPKYNFTASHLTWMTINYFKLKPFSISS